MAKHFIHKNCVNLSQKHQAHMCLLFIFRKVGFIYCACTCECECVPTKSYFGDKFVPKSEVNLTNSPKTSIWGRPHL